MTKAPQKGDVHSRVAPEIKADFEKWAAEEGRTLSNYLRRVLEEHHAGKKAAGKRK